MSEEFSPDKIAELTEKYQDIDGKPCSFFKLVRDEPEWAVSRIEILRARVAEIERLKADLAHAMGCGGGTHEYKGIRRDGLGPEIPMSTWNPCPICQDIKAELSGQKPAKEKL